MKRIDLCLVCTLILWVGGCAQSPSLGALSDYGGARTTVQASGRAPDSLAPQSPAALTPKPFAEAIAHATQELLAQLPADMPERIVVVDPLIDGVTGEQNAATQSVEAHIRKYVKAKHPRLSLHPLTVSNLERKPLLLIGTVTGVNDQGHSAGQRVKYRVCLSLADTASDRIIAKGTAHAVSEGVDLTPLAYFRDAPAWASDRLTEGYIRSCQNTEPGDPIDPFYRARLISAASINLAIEAHNAGRYQNALDFYAIAIRTGAGEELRILNGLYLANWKLKRHDASRLIAQRIIDFGLTRKRMAMKFLFQPGAISFWEEPDFAAANPMWIEELASRADQSASCLEIAGHSSHGAPDNGDVGLSQDRAQFVRLLLVHQRPRLEKRIRATGRGAAENLIGNGRNDVSDVLDRRVVFKVTDCAAPET